jgi:hypothetical protein
MIYSNRKPRTLYFSGSTMCHHSELLCNIRLYLMNSLGSRSKHQAMSHQDIQQSVHNLSSFIRSKGVFLVNRSWEIIAAHRTDRPNIQLYTMQHHSATPSSQQVNSHQKQISLIMFILNSGFHPPTLAPTRHPCPTSTPSYHQYQCLSCPHLSKWRFLPHRHLH